MHKQINLFSTTNQSMENNERQIRYCRSCVCVFLFRMKRFFLVTFLENVLRPALFSRNFLEFIVITLFNKRVIKISCFLDLMV